MVTLITEKLRNQSLDDLARRAHEASLYSAEKLKSGYLFPLEISVSRSPRKASHGGWAIGSQAAASSPFSSSPCGVSHTEGPCPFSSRRRLSLSQEHLVDAGACLPSASSTPTSTPELGRRYGLLRCRSQPCVLDGRRGRRKRRREEDTRWTRPSLDFLKMTRTLRNSKSLCSLDCEDDGEDDTQAKTVVSSPCDSQGLVDIITPGSSPRISRPCPASPSPWVSREPEVGMGEGENSGDPSDWDSAGEEGVFPLAHSDLDLEQIENN